MSQSMNLVRLLLWIKVTGHTGHGMQGWFESTEKVSLKSLREESFSLLGSMIPMVKILHFVQDDKPWGFSAVSDGSHVSKTVWLYPVAFKKRY